MKERTRQLLVRSLASLQKAPSIFWKTWKNGQSTMWESLPIQMWERDRRVCPSLSAQRRMVCVRKQNKAQAEHPVSSLFTSPLQLLTSSLVTYNLLFFSTLLYLLLTVPSFGLKNFNSLCKSTFFWLFSPTMLLNFNTWYGIFTCWPATSSTNCHFFKKKKTKLLCSVFEWKDFFYVSPSWNLSKRQVVDSWNKKGGRYFFFLKAICIFLPSCDLIIFCSYSLVS